MSGSDRARTALGIIRLANGGLALLAPGRLARTFGVGEDAAGPAAYALRLFGVRTIFLGLSILRPGDREAELRRAPYIHACDTAAAVIAGLKGQLPPRAAATGAAMSSVNTALALVARRCR